MVVPNRAEIMVISDEGESSSTYKFTPFFVVAERMKDLASMNCLSISLPWPLGVAECCLRSREGSVWETSSLSWVLTSIVMLILQRTHCTSDKIRTVNVVCGALLLLLAVFYMFCCLPTALPSMAMPSALSDDVAERRCQLFCWQWASSWTQWLIVTLVSVR